MKTAEIKALHETIGRAMGGELVNPYQLMEAAYAAIETLLAREVKIRKVIGKGATTGTEAWQMVDEIRAILNPENKT